MKGLVMTRLLLRVVPAAMIAGLTIAPVSVHAAAPLVFHGKIADSAENVDLCGINVDFSSTGVFTDMLFLDSAGNFLHFMEALSVKNTFTADNGKSVVIQASNLFVDPGAVIDEAAGTITFSATYKGLPEKISTPQGPVLLRDAGVITFSDTFDLNTFDHISSDVVIMGPHPEAESDFVLFCEVITAALA
jgi:hypothetical protein